MTITDADRPDPARNRPASARYAAHWARTHEAVEDQLGYRAAYPDILLIDRLLTDYTMLDVGCGTGGYLKLARRHARITAIDFSASMIDEARRLQAELGVERVTFECALFESYGTQEIFDVVRMGGVVGWYRPWPGNEGALAKARDLVPAGGLVIATYVRPRSLFDLLKTALFPRKTRVIAEAKFLRLAAAMGLTHLFSIETPNASLAFLRKAIPGNEGR